MIEKKCFLVDVRAMGMSDKVHFMVTRAKGVAIECTSRLSKQYAADRNRPEMVSGGALPRGCKIPWAMMFNKKKSVYTFCARVMTVAYVKYRS